MYSTTGPRTLREAAQDQSDYNDALEQLFGQRSEEARQVDWQGLLSYLSEREENAVSVRNPDQIGLSEEDHNPYLLNQRWTKDGLRNPWERISDAEVIPAESTVCTPTVSREGVVEDPKDIQMQDLEKNQELQKDIAQALPKHYSFDIEKIVQRIWRSDQNNLIRTVGLQMPDGLIAWAPPIAAIIEKYTLATAIIFGDTNFGACCVDDITAKRLNVDLLVHFGHSCLVPTDQKCATRVIYVKVEITIDRKHLLETIEKLFFDEKSEHYLGEGEKEFALLSTVQFASSLAKVRDGLKGYGRCLQGNGARERRVKMKAESKERFGKTIVQSPAEKPLTKGETLGCTAAHIPSHVKYVLFVCDGRFHLEASMMKNPQCVFFLYNPYSKEVSLERYDFKRMIAMRQEACLKVEQAICEAEALDAVEESLDDTDGVIRNVVDQVVEERLQLSFDRLSIGNKSFSEWSSEKLKRWQAEVEKLRLESLKGTGGDVRYCRKEPLVRKEETPTRFENTKSDRFLFMKTKRKEEKAELKKKTKLRIGLILGTLGRQGSPAILKRIKTICDRREFNYFALLMADVSPDRLRDFDNDVDCYVQIACPRLSIDWGSAYGKPLLTTYEFFRMFQLLRGVIKLDSLTEDNVAKWLDAVTEGGERSCGLGNGTELGCCSGKGGCGGGEGEKRVKTEEAQDDVIDVDAIKKYWPPMDYWSNQGGVWSNYGGNRGERRFEHMEG